MIPEENGGRRHGLAGSRDHHGVNHPGLQLAARGDQHAGSQMRPYDSEDAGKGIRPKARIGRADRGLCDYRAGRRLRRHVDEVGRQRQPLAAERLEDLDLEC